MLSETRERFVRAILAQVPAEEIVEIHFFAPIKQAGIESGVAVVASKQVPTESPSSGNSELVPHEGPPSGDNEVVPEEGPSTGDFIDDRPPRFTVYTARYRLTLKGPDRGKWEASVVAEADAPLLTVDAVVRGVQRRSGDAEDAERMGGDELRGALGMHSDASRE